MKIYRNFSWLKTRDLRVEASLGVMLMAGIFLASITPAKAEFTEAQIRANQVFGLKVTSGSEVSVELKGAQLDLNDPTSGFTLPKLNNSALLVESLPSHCVELMRTAFSSVTLPIRVEIIGRLRGANFVSLTPVVKFEPAQVQCSLAKSD